MTVVEQPDYARLARADMRVQQAAEALRKAQQELWDAQAKQRYAASLVYGIR